MVDARLPVMGTDSSSLSPPTAGPLDGVLQGLRIADATYGRCEMTAPWGLDFPAVPDARFHFVGVGPCWLRTDGDGWVELAPGDVVLVPRGRGHALADVPGRPTVSTDDLPQEPLGDGVYTVRAGGGGARSLLFCGTAQLDLPEADPLLDLMPPVVFGRGAAERDPALPTLLDIMSDEVTADRAGGAALLARLVEVVIARIVRDWAETEPDAQQGWLAALRDPAVGRALVAVHRDPGAPWTVDSLAAAAGVSRSAFAERFAALVGVPPAQYVARWRMRLAAGRLRDGRQTVAEVAAEIGYDSAPSFSRAFKRVVGMPPNALRPATL